MHYMLRAHKSSPFCFGCLQFDECGLKIRDCNGPSMRRRRRKNQRKKEHRGKDQAEQREKKLDGIRTRDRERAAATTRNMKKAQDA